MPLSRETFCKYRGNTHGANLKIDFCQFKKPFELQLVFAHFIILYQPFAEARRELFRLDLNQRLRRS